MKYLSSLLLTLLFIYLNPISQSGLYAQPNDNICAAIPLTLGATCTNSFNNIGAGSQSGEPTPLCFSGGVNSVWFKVTNPSSGASISITTDFTGFTLNNTEIAVYDLDEYDDCGILSDLVEIACSQDNGVNVPTNARLVNIPTTLLDPANGIPDTTYIQVSGFNGAQGTFCIEVEEYNPTNDDVADAISLPIDGAIRTFANESATIENNENKLPIPQDFCSGTSGWCDTLIRKSVWFNFTVDNETKVSIDLCTGGFTDYDSKMAVFEVGNPNDFNSFNFLAANDDGPSGCGLDSYLEVSCLSPGNDYYILVDGYFGSDGNLGISLTDLGVSALNASAGSDKNICAGETETIGGSPSASGGVGNYTYSWSPSTGLNATNIANPQASPSSTTTYILTVTDADDCSESSSVTVTVNPDDNPFFSYPNDACKNASSNPQPNSVSTPGGTFIVNGNASINSSTGVLDLNSTQAGTSYAITYTTNGICPASSVQNILIKAADDPFFSYPNDVCINSSSDPQPNSVTTPGGTFSVNGNASINPNTGELDLNTTQVGTTYTITYTTNGDCPASSVQNILIKAADDPFFSYPNEACKNASSNPQPNSINTAGGTFSVSGNANINPSTGVLDLSSTQGGISYIITYSTNGDCPESSTQTIFIKSADNPDFSYPAEICKNASSNPQPISINTPGGLFSVNGNANINASTGELDLNSTQGGTTYTITYTTSGDCPESSIQNLLVKAADNAGFAYPSQICINANANPVATNVILPGGSFSVNNGASINALTGELDLSTTQAGTTYTVSYQTNGVCPSSDNKNILVKAADDPGFSYPSEVCINANQNPIATITGLTGGVFGVDNGASIDVFTGELDLSTTLAGINYTITYQTLGECPAFSTQSILVKAADDPSFSYASEVCINALTNPVASNVVQSGGTFAVDNGASINPNTGELDLSSTTAGVTYTVSYQTAGDCPESSTQSILVKAADDPGFTYASEVCINSIVNPVATNIIQTGGTFSVDNGASINPNSGELDLSSTTAGITYTIGYQTAGDCPESSTQSILVKTADDPSFSYASEICINASNNPAASNIVQSGGTFSVDNGASINANTGELDLSSTTAGVTYTISYQTAGDCPESSTQSILVKAADNPAFTYASEVCINASSNPAASNIMQSGGTFAVDNGASINANTGELDLSSTTAGVSYTISYQTAGDCPESSTQSILVKAADDPAFTYASEICINASTNPLASNIVQSGGTFSVNNGASINANTGELDLSSTTAGVSYTISYQTAGDCPESSTQSILVKAADDPAFTYASEICINASSNPAASNIVQSGGTFSVDNGASINPNTGELDLSSTTAGITYTIRYQTVGDCPESSTQTILVKAEDDPRFSYPTEVCINASSNPAASNIVQFGGIFSVNNGASINANTGELDLNSTTAGVSYTINYQTVGDCPESSTQTILVKAADDPSFSFPSEVCINAAINPVAVISGLTGGSFSVDNGASINSASGVLDLSTTIAGVTYTITYQTAGDCPESSTQMVLIKAADDPGFTYASEVCINATANPVASNIVQSGGMFTVDNGASINANTGELDLSSTLAGVSYTINYQTAGDCPAASMQTILVKAADDPGFTYATEICINATVNPVASSIVQSGGMFTVDNGASINANTGELDISSTLAATTYTITYQTAGDCPASSTQSILVKAADDPTFSYPSEVCINATINPVAVISGLTGGTFSSDNGIINPFSGELDLSSVVPGTVCTITYTTNGDCPESFSQQIFIKAADDPSFTYPFEVCIDAAVQPSATITGLAGGSFSVDNGASIDPITGALDLSTTLGDNLYTITYTTNGDCPASSIQQIFVLAVDDPSFSFNAEVCINASSNPVATLTGLPSGSFSVDNGASIDPSTGELDLSSTSPGTTYTITYNTNGFCPSSSSQQVLIKQADDAAFSLPSVACLFSGNNPVATVNGLPGGTFSVDNGAFIDSNTGELDLFSLSLGQTYTVTYTTNGDCPSSSTQQIHAQLRDDPRFTYPLQVCINGGNPIANIIGTPGGTFSVDNGAIINPGTGELNISSANANVFYTITYATNGVCPDTSTQQLFVEGLSDASFSLPATACILGQDPQAVVTGDPGGFFNIDNGAFIDSNFGIIDLSTTVAGQTYTVTYSTVFGCVSSSSRQITIQSAGDASFAFPATACINSAQNPIATLTGDAGGTFSVDNGASIDQNSGELDITSTSVGTTYTISYQTSGNCSSSSSQQVLIEAADDPGFSYPATACINAVMNPMPSISGLSGGVFSIDNGALIDSANGELDLNSTMAGQTYTVTYTTAGNCPESSTQQIQILQSDNAGFSFAESVCINAASNPIATITGLSGGSFKVNNGASIDAATGELMLSSTSAGQSYTITYTTMGPCPDSASKQIQVDFADDPGFSFPESVCINATTNPVAMVNGLSGGTFSVDNGASIDPVSGELDLSTTMEDQTYTITYTTNGECPSFTTQQISIQAVEDASFSFPDSACISSPNNPIGTITGASGGIFSVDNEAIIDPISGELDLNSTLAGTTYTISYQTSGECFSISERRIEIVAPLDTLSINALNMTSDPGQDNGIAWVEIAGGVGPYEISWNTGATTDTIAGLSPGSYTVSVTDQCGELLTATVDIFVTSIEDIKKAGLAQLQVFPNPMLGKFKIEIELLNPIELTLVLYDLKGKEIWRDFRESALQYKREIDLQDRLSEGIYVLEIRTSTGAVYQRLIRR